MEVINLKQEPVRHISGKSGDASAGGFQVALIGCLGGPGRTPHFVVSNFLARYSYPVLQMSLMGHK